MAFYFLDTSVLVKLYVEELGSASVDTLTTAPGAKLATSSLGVLEFRATIRARQRRGLLRDDAAAIALAHFADWAARALLRQALTDAVFELAAALLDRHPLRAPDALQLAACVALHRHQPAAALYFVCSDQALLRAAAAEHIPCWDPAQAETHPA